MNDKLSAKRAANYLIQKGHKKIAAIFKADDGQGHLRYAGYVEAMLEADLMLDDKNIIWLDTEGVRELKEEKNQILSRIGNCTAVFCYNDEIAFSFIEMCQKEGIQIPEELSVIAIDNSELAELSDVPFTSIPHPSEELGKKAANNLVKMIADNKFDGNYEFETVIVERQSVKVVE